MPKIEKIRNGTTKTDLSFNFNHLLHKMSPLTRGKLVRGILIDITGVLYESGTTVAISGSIEALELLKKSTIPYKFVTNETQITRFGLTQKLRNFGFTLEEDDIFAPAPATCKYLIENNLVPHLLVHPSK